MKCYACDSEATGLRDRRPEGGRLEGRRLEAACPRHADPTVPSLSAYLAAEGLPQRRAEELLRSPDSLTAHQRRELRAYAEVG